MKKIVYIIVTIFLSKNICFAETKNESIEITANKMEWNKESEKATAIGNAVAIQGKKIIKADKIVANLNKGNNTQEISSLLALGRVIFTRAGEKITSKEAFYDIQNEIITLKGNVNFQKEDNIMKGEKLVIDFKTGISQLLGGKEKQKVRMKYNSIEKEINEKD